MFKQKTFPFDFVSYGVFIGAKHFHLTQMHKPNLKENKSKVNQMWWPDEILLLIIAQGKRFKLTATLIGLAFNESSRKKALKISFFEFI